MTGKLLSESRPLEKYEYHGRIPTKINNWGFIKVGNAQLPRIKGKHYGHSKSRAGEEIITAGIMDFYCKKYSLRIICEDGMEYELGKMDTEYEKKCPDVIERTKTFYKKLNEKEE